MPSEYDTAVRQHPETCPMYYMGDHRTGHQLLAEANADAAITVTDLARHLAAVACSRCEQNVYINGFRAGIGCSGYMRACGGRGLLEGIARMVGGLASFVESAGASGVECDAWARAVQDFSANLYALCPRAPLRIESG
jgi:hypothetical protein